jgi:hypothetical protein
MASKEPLHTLLVSSDETNDANETSDWEARIDSSGMNESTMLDNVDEENEAIRERSEV